MFTPPRLPRRLRAQTHNKMAVLLVLYVTAACVDLGAYVKALRMQLHRTNDVCLTAQYTNNRPEFSYWRHGTFRVPKDWGLFFLEKSSFECSVFCLHTAQRNIHEGGMGIILIQGGLLHQRSLATLKSRPLLLPPDNPCIYCDIL